MSNAPTLDTHPTVPVGPELPPLTMHGAPSGVPSAAACHSAFVGKRFPAFRAAAAWNQVRNPVQLEAKDKAAHTGKLDSQHSLAVDG